jgi:AcrR family transcriptional regulator
MPSQLERLNKSKPDPRVIRTRRLLLDSFKSLLDEQKAIREISVQSITKHAGVNRATFYAHFVDKYDLMAFWKRELFRQALEEKLLDNQAAENISFDQLIDTVLDFAINYRRYFRRLNREYEPLFETALLQELKVILKSILEKDSLYTAAHNIESEATFISWAIFGSATEWSRDQKRLSKEAIAEQIVRLVKTITMP